MNNRNRINEKRIINIVTLFSNEGEVIQYAKKLSIQSVFERIILIIVVNKRGTMSKAEFLEKINNIDLKIYTYETFENLGYLNGLIYGYKKFSEKHKVTDWVVMSNTDISFENNDFFKKFFEEEFSEDIWVVGPSVYSSKNKTYENPQYKYRHTINSINRKIFIFKKPMIAYFYFKFAKIKAKKRKKIKLRSQFAYSVHGCFFFVRENLIEQLMHKQYGALMYSEEAYLAEIVRMNNKKCFYNSELEIIHNESSVTGKLTTVEKARYFEKSLEFIKQEFYF